MSTEYRSHLPGCDLFSVRPCHCNVGHDHVTETGYLAEAALKAENARLRDKRSLQVLNLEAQLETAKGDNATLQQQLRDTEASNRLSRDAFRQLQDARCADCGLAYGCPGWCDVVVPNKVWNNISDGAAILCFVCMTKRIEECGLKDVPVMVVSGPYKDSNEEWRLIGLEHGQKLAQAEIDALQSKLIDAKEGIEAQMEAAHSWRTEADRLANENAELRRQLEQSTF